MPELPSQGPDPLSSLCPACSLGGSSLLWPLCLSSYLSFLDPETPSFASFKNTPNPTSSMKTFGGKLPIPPLNRCLLCAGFGGAKTTSLSSGKKPGGEGYDESGLEEVYGGEEDYVILSTITIVKKEKAYLGPSAWDTVQLSSAFKALSGGSQEVHSCRLSALSTYWVPGTGLGPRVYSHE